MNSSEKVLAIYHALRLEFGQTIPAGELLAAAYATFDEYRRLKQGDGWEDGERNRPVLPGIPTDEALSDGGWKILEFERKQTFDPDECTLGERARIQQRIKDILERP